MVTTQQHQDHEARIRLLEEIARENLELNRQGQERLTRLEEIVLDTRSRVSNLENVTQENQGRIINLEVVAQDTRERVTNLEVVAQDTRERVTNLESVTQDTRERVTNLESVTQDTRERVTNLEVVAQDIRERLTNVESVTVENREQLRFMSQTHGQLRGAMLESQLNGQIQFLAETHCDLSNTQILKGNAIPMDHRLQHPLELAQAQSRITDQQALQVKQTDFILQGFPFGQSPVWLTVEASCQVGEYDILRSRDRAQILNDATGQPAHAAVAGYEIADPERELAARHQVTVILVAAKV